MLNDDELERKKRSQIILAGSRKKTNTPEIKFKEEREKNRTMLAA